MTPFEVAVPGGALRGHRSGSGEAALLLHGGAAVPDYLAPCAEALDGLFACIRYTQRGTAPSSGDPPYTIETHVADAIAVADACGIERAWAIGHSWGGHLALHLALAHRDRLSGLLLIDPLGADPAVFAEMDANLRRGLDDAGCLRLDTIEQRRRDGAVTEDELVERFALLWPQFFVVRAAVPEAPARVGVQASIETNRSIAEHYGAETLRRGLPSLGLRALFVHGEDDPLPLRSTTATAALIDGSRVETVPRCGHFPWLERPTEFRTAVELLLDPS